MGTGLRRQEWRIAAAALVPAALMLALRLTPWSRWIYQSVSFHLVLVSAIAACAVVVAVVAAAAAARTRTPSLVLLAVGCECVGALMLGHGLCTPGVIGRPLNVWVGRLPVIGMTLFACCLVLAASKGGRAWIRWIGDHASTTLLGTGAVLLLTTTVIVTDPTKLGGTHRYAWEDDAMLFCTVVASAALIVTGMRHWRRWQLSTDPVQAAMFGANVLTACALIAQRTGTLWHLAWWDYHGYLLAGFAGAAWTVLVAQHRASAAHDALELAFEDDAFAQISSGYPEALRALVVAVEVKDSYTHGHSARVAEVAVQLGTRLALPPQELRVLAQGAYLHDIGKIAVSDVILNKPGPLTVEERAVIESHPEAGCRIAGEVSALSSALAVIRHHHERWDGTGYPAGLGAAQIPMVARVAAVADVWDALTSDRSYRAGWAPGRALAHITAASGTHFDPRCVAAFEQLAAEWGIVPEGDGDALAVVAAATAPCPD